MAALRRPMPCWRGWAGVLLLGLFCTAGCSSLPIIVPDLARSDARPVRIEAAASDGAHGAGQRGPLSAARSQAILDGLRSQGRDTDVFDRHLALEEAIVGSPLTAGNDVRLLQDGPATYRAMLAAIAAARDHINMETYILDDDEVGRHFAQALIDKQRQGVQVLEFNPVNPLQARKDWALNQRDHRKLLIVDGRIAFLGGINISSVYSGGSFNNKRSAAPADGRLAWRDTDLRLQGPVVAEFQKLFIDAWASQKGAALAPRNYFPKPVSAGRLVVRAIGSSPDEPFSQIYATLLSAIGSAETSVYLTNAYFAPDPQLLAALEAAVQRGVDVTLILPAQTDSWLVFHAGRGYYERLLRAGVKIFERRGVILHSKTALIDGVWATVGSTNLDWRSFLHNHELNAVVLGAPFGLQMKAMFDADLAASDAITLAQWQRRPFDLRLKEWLARAWEYWL